MFFQTWLKTILLTLPRFGQIQFTAKKRVRKEITNIWSTDNQIHRELQEFITIKKLPKTKNYCENAMFYQNSIFFSSLYILPDEQKFYTTVGHTVVPFSTSVFSLGTSSSNSPFDIWLKEPNSSQKSFHHKEQLGHG